MFWLLFLVFVLAMLALDLGVFHRRAHAIRFREALAWSLFWIALSAAFAVLVYFWRGRTPALEFVTGYVVEEALSVDNLFVFLLIFRYFRVPDLYQHRVLFWGIVGALVMRGFFILAGVTLINRFHWLIYLFGAFLVFIGIRLGREAEAEVHPEQNAVLKLLRRHLPLTPDYVGGEFFVRADGLYATPLLLVLVFVEITDVTFATDSIPAVLAISRDPFVVFTSNVFAVLGLRALYFVLAGMMELFHHLHYGLAAILVFIGLKMLLSEIWPIPTWIALLVVAALLAAAVTASMILPRKAPS